MMKPKIPQLLAALYGHGQTAATAARLQSLLEKHLHRHASSPPGQNTRPLSQRDALLITYADQVRADGLSPLGALGEFCSHRLGGLVSGVHLLPFYPWSSDDGFSVKDFFSVDPDYGNWEDIERLGAVFDLMFDAVFNHVSVQGEWFQGFLRDDPRFRDFFITVEGGPDLSQVVRPRTLPLLTGFQTAAGFRKVWTTFSADQADLNFKNPDVLLAVLEALLFYAAQGARFIRLDAVAFLWKEPGTSCLHLPQTHQVIQLMRAVLDEVAPRVRLITETNVPHVDNLSYFGDGANEAQLVYNFALPPLVLHSFQTGNAESLSRWASSLALPSGEVTFFNFLASHDGIGLNPARGILTDAEIAALVERTLRRGGFVSKKRNPDGSESPYELNINYFDALSDPGGGEPLELQVRRFLCAHAIMLAMPGMPGLYFHSLFGSRGDRAGAETSGIPRRINRQKLQRADLERELADPASRRSLVFGGLKKLLEARRVCPAFAPSAPHRVLFVDPRVFALWRGPVGENGSVLCLHNTADEPVSCRLPDVVGGRVWRNLLGNDLSTVRGVLSPYETAWLFLTDQN